MEPLLLCVEMDPGKMLRLSFLASSLGIGVREVPRDRQGMTLGMLCGMDRPGIGKHAQTAPGEMLVMAFLREEQMDRLLRGMRGKRLHGAPESRADAQQPALDLLPVIPGAGAGSKKDKVWEGGSVTFRLAVQRGGNPLRQAVFPGKTAVARRPEKTNRAARQECRPLTAN